ncbi:eukaryotic rpb5 RNA polymerase subunit family protein [Actinidia rufa]|uniref:Eukaryotic rpb5 RNA polymerase subunit family protein n=1 Tax=Actinidia rufa TaxID=165716 RepID=A0A7J0FIY4_9ERIC|nr:eukaryotic rpb5 RNA polymerase subunit family protein [Actinidia rufa]
MEGEAAQGMDLNGEAYDRCLSSYVDDGSTESHRYYLSRRTALEMLRDRGYSVPASEVELSLSKTSVPFTAKTPTSIASGSPPRSAPTRLTRLPLNWTKVPSSWIEIWPTSYKSLKYFATSAKRCSSMELEHQLLPMVVLSLSLNLCLPCPKSTAPVVILRGKHILILVVFCGQGVVKVNVIRIIATQIINKDTLSRLIIIVQNRVTNQALKAVDLFNFKVEIFQITELLVNITKHEFKPKHRVLTDKEKKKLLEKFTLEEKQLPRMLQKDAIARYYGLEKGQVVKVSYSGDITESHVSYRCVW